MSIVCSICTHSVATGKVVITKCSHLFHEQCILKWLKKSSICPICRIGMRKQSLRQVFVDQRDDIFENTAVKSKIEELQTEIGGLASELGSKKRECAGKKEPFKPIFHVLIYSFLLYCIIILFYTFN